MLSITNLENDLPWTPHVGAGINPITADYYRALKTPQGVQLSMYSNNAYGGWLCSGLSQLYKQVPQIVLNYNLTIDAATPLSAQVAETDTKITDASGYTYDGSGQWNINQGWIWQVGNPWVSTSVKMPVPPTPYVPVKVAISYLMDYVKHTLVINRVTVNGIGMKCDPSITTQPGQLLGWQKSSILTQLQQCNNNQPGGYSLLYTGISYDLRDTVSTSTFGDGDDDEDDEDEGDEHHKHHHRHHGE